MSEYDVLAKRIYSDYKEHEEKINKRIDEICLILGNYQQSCSDKFKSNDNDVIILDSTVNEHDVFIGMERLREERENHLKRLSEYFKQTNMRLEELSVKKILNLPI